MITKILSLSALSFLGQLITLVLTPLLLSVYEPEDFSVYATISSIVGICSIVVIQKRDILLSKLKSRFVIGGYYEHLKKTILKDALFLSVIVLPLALWYGFTLLEFIMFLFLFLSTVFSLIKINFLIALERIKKASFIKLFQAASVVPFQMFIFILNGGLVFGKSLSNIVVLLAKVSFQKGNIKTEKLDRANRRNRVFLTLEGLVNKISSHFLFLVIPILFTEKENGLFFICYSLIFIPIGILVDSTSKIYFRNLRASSLWALTIKITLLLMLTSVVLSVSIKPVLELVLGYIGNEQWNSALLFIGPTLVWATSIVLFGHFQYFNIYVGKQNFNLMFQVVLMLMRFFTIYYCYSTSKPLEITLYIFGGGSFLLWLLFAAFSVGHFYVKSRRSS